MQLAWIAMVCTLVACASAGAPLGNPSDDDDVPIDAPKQPDARQVTGDAPMSMIDAGLMLDAFVFLDAPADAASPFCTANNQCVQPGQCCIRLGGPQGFCGNGIPFADDCIPQ